MKLAKRITLVVFFLLVLLPAYPVHADMAPPPAPMLTGLEPFQYQNTQVQMVYERVEMELQNYQAPDSDRLSSRVLVKASFVMHNRGIVPETMQSIFPMESLTHCAMGYGGGNNYSYTYYSINEDSFEIAVDGNAVSTQEVTTPHPYKDQLPGNSCSDMRWIGFTVTFPVNVDVVVTVNYSMDALGTDAMQNIDYVLETGAGWYGPIERAYIIVKFPYIVNNQNILIETTSGYQTLYNEIFWSFQDIEPTSKDNIRVSIVSPGTWQAIQSIQGQLRENSSLPYTWADLAETYETIAYWHGYNVRSDYYAEKALATYEQAIVANPQSGYLLARMACYKLKGLEPVVDVKRSSTELVSIQVLLSKSLALDSTNDFAQECLKELKGLLPNMTFTPPATIPPTSTSAISSTPTATPLPSVTPRPSLTPVVVTAVNTKIVTATPQKSILTRTTVPLPTQTIMPTPDATPVATPGNTNSAGINWTMWPVLFIIGSISGIFITKKKWI